MAHAGRILDDVRRAEARILAADAYQAELSEEFERSPHGVWKFERAQEFFEPDVASRRAMTSGDWDRSLAMLGDPRARDLLAGHLHHSGTFRA